MHRIRDAPRSALAGPSPQLALEAFLYTTATVVFARTGDRVTARIEGPLTDAGRVVGERDADDALHRAGFLHVYEQARHFHRLPLPMADAAEQRRVVTRAMTFLHSDGFATVCPPELLDATPVPSGDLGRMAERLWAADHSREALDVLAELTAPGDGVLVQISTVLSYIEELWRSLDPLFELDEALQMQELAGRASVLEHDLRHLYRDFADRYPSKPMVSAAARVQAAHAASPALSGGLTSAPARGEAPGAAARASTSDLARKR
ncbi:hypothetical protein [Streptacidiphilus sp. MAP5-52]|uniref:hypothetical protein n=1 Tax=Streptacidiphilus sp. MAP5-52 TaxID=3156267 RepID=UPI0035120764